MLGFLCCLVSLPEPKRCFVPNANVKGSIDLPPPNHQRHPNPVVPTRLVISITSLLPAAILPKRTRLFRNQIRCSYRPDGSIPVHILDQ